MQDVIEVVMKKDQRLIGITAPGGRGKTTAAKKLMHGWAKNMYLEEFHIVIRIDVKGIDYGKSLFENIVNGNFSATQLDELKEDLRVHQKKALFMLDGILRLKSSFKTINKCTPRVFSSC